MPDRIVRASILDSRAFNELTDEAEVLYRRLLSVVDDFGCYEADPELIQAKCFWRKVDQWGIDRISRALADICKQTNADGSVLMRMYAVDGRDYLRIYKLGKPRAIKPRYPLPPEDICQQAQADANICLQTQTSDKSVRYSNTTTTTTTNTTTNKESREEWDAESAFRELWTAYPAKGRVDFTLSQQYYIEEIRNAETHATALESVTTGKWAKSEKWAKGFIKAFPVWLHNRAWETEDPEPATQPTPASASVSPVSTMDPETARRIREARNG